MTDHEPEERPPTEPAPAEPAPAEPGPVRRPRRRRDPVTTLNLALLVYIFVTMIFALPLVIAPAGFLDLVGLPDAAADELGGLRWMGAVLLAWVVSGILVLARPSGRAIFVTTGALQMTFGALAFLYSWSVGEYAWSSWYHGFGTAILVVASVVLWWARLAGRKLFREDAAA